MCGVCAQILYVLGKLSQSGARTGGQCCRERITRNHHARPAKPAIFGGPWGEAVYLCQQHFVKKRCSFCRKFDRSKKNPLRTDQYCDLRPLNKLRQPGRIGAVKLTMTKAEIEVFDLKLAIGLFYTCDVSPPLQALGQVERARGKKIEIEPGCTADCVDHSRGPSLKCPADAGCSESNRLFSNRSCQFKIR